MSSQKSQGASLSEATDYFKRIPWCADLLEAPGVVLFMPTNRRGISGCSTSHDRLFQDSLNTSDAVPCMLGFYPDPEAAAAAEARATTTTTTTTTTTATAAKSLLIRSASLLCDLRAGVNGFNGTVQGGFLAAVIDEAMGNLLFNNFAYQRQLEEEQRSSDGSWKAPPDILSLGPNARLFTASMALRFQKPLATPCVVVATAALSRIDGRKLFFDVTVRDQHGTEYVRCEGLWIALREGPNM